jgi:ATP-binding cassette subfamily B protein
MDHGQIVERGTHNALLSANGRYAEMWQMQERATID